MNVNFITTFIIIIYVEATPEEISRYSLYNKGSTIPVINVHGAINP